MRSIHLIGLVFAVLMALAACTPANKAPTASFTVAPASGDTTTAFAFDASGSSDPDGSIVSYTWDFGDAGAPVITQEPTTTHGFAEPGTYTVELTVTDDKGATATATREVAVSAAVVGTVSGYVVNRRAGTAVEGATVTVEDTSVSAITDANGFYSLSAPVGFVTLIFNKEGHAESKVTGLRVEEGQETEYSTIQLEIFDPFLPVEAPTLNVGVENGATLTGSGEDDSFSFTVSGEVAEPYVNDFIFTSAALGQSRGNSGHLNQFVPGIPVDFDGGELGVMLAASGFEGETTLHVVAYDLNQNRTEVIRYVTVDSSVAVAENLANPTELEALALTFNDVSVFGTLGVGSGVNVRTLLKAVKSGDIEALREQAESINEVERSLQPQQALDEVVTWIDLFFTYDVTTADLPTAFQIYRKLEGEAIFRLIGQVSPFQADLDPTDSESVEFSFRDTTPAVQSGLTATYRVEAVAGDMRESSAEASVTPLPPFSVSAGSPEDGTIDVSVSPTYEMSFEGRSDIVFYGVVVLDRVHASGNLIEWVYLADPETSGVTSTSTEHNVDGTATLPNLQLFHAYDWQPVAITARDDFSAIAVAADFFDIFGVGFSVVDGPINTFVTGDGSN